MEDYHRTLIPEAERRIERHKALRVLLILGAEFEGMTPAAMWADAKLGLRYWADFGRVAVVTDVDWVEKAVRLFAPLFHHPVRVFPNSALDAAERWIVQ